jgi:hypothetical protein
MLSQKSENAANKIVSLFGSQAWEREKIMLITQLSHQ